MDRAKSIFNSVCLTTLRIAARVQNAMPRICYIYVSRLTWKQVNSHFKIFASCLPPGTEGHTQHTSRCITHAVTKSNSMHITLQPVSKQNKKVHTNLYVHVTILLSQLKLSTTADTVLQPKT